jgi:hypothetical protein
MVAVMPPVSPEKTQSEKPKLCGWNGLCYTGPNRNFNQEMPVKASLGGQKKAKKDFKEEALQ